MSLGWPKIVLYGYYAKLVGMSLHWFGAVLCVHYAALVGKSLGWGTLSYVATMQHLLA